MNTPPLDHGEQKVQSETQFVVTDEFYPVDDRVLARFGGVGRLLEKAADFVSQLDHIDARTGDNIKKGSSLV